MLDKIDRMILDIICNDANISNAKLAKAIGIHTATVTRRIDAMLDKKLIAIQAVPDHFRMGYNTQAIITLNVDLANIDSLSIKLIDSPNVRLAVTTFGRYDILMLVAFPDWGKLNSFLSDSVSQWLGVKRTNIFLISETKKVPRDIFHTRFNPGPPIVLDDIDNKLIQELRKDGRASCTYIAHELGVNPATVSRRLDSLLEKKIIKIMAVPNPSKFGYSANAFIMLGTERGKANEICAELNSYPQTQTSHILAAGFDIIISVQFTNPELLYEFVRSKIARIRGISTVETLIVAEYIKSTYSWVDFDSIS